MSIFRIFVILSMVILFMAGTSYSQKASSPDLAKQAQNPIANLDTALITGESYLSNQQCDRQENEFSHVEIKE